MNVKKESIKSNLCGDAVKMMQYLFSVFYFFWFLNVEKKNCEKYKPQDDANNQMKTNIEKKMEFTEERHEKNLLCLFIEY